MKLFNFDIGDSRRGFLGCVAHFGEAGQGIFLKRISLGSNRIIAGSMALAVSALAVTNTQAQTPVSADQNVTLAPIEVTGSLIRTTDRVTFNQVQVVTAQDIEASGEVTLICATGRASWALGASSACSAGTSSTHSSSDPLYFRPALLPTHSSSDPLWFRPTLTR
jgi:iron complex outermembrane receptor protein